MKQTLYVNSHGTLQRDQNTLLLETEDGQKRSCRLKACANCTSSGK